MIHVFGFTDEKAKQYAEWCGIAFQLTNILRDVREDAAMGRIYLPLEDLNRFGVTEEQILKCQPPPAFVDLMKFESDRAHDYYDKAHPLLSLIHADSRGTLVALMEIYRGLLKISPEAHDSTASVECDALLLDEKSRTDTVPDIQVKNNDVTVAHEARVGKLSEEDLFYLMSRGISEEEAKAMIVNGFIEPIVRMLPLEYAVEMNRLIEMEMEGSVG